MDVTASLNATKAIQAAFGMVQLLNLTAWRYPPPCTLRNGTKYDFIIVGGGTAGSVLANRLSKNCTNSVLLIEAGGYPPIEADDFPGLPLLLAGSNYEYGYYAQNDHCTAQNLQNCGISLIAGKMLGGSGSLQPLYYIRGFPYDYNQWAELLHDDAWNYTNILQYFKKIENLVNEDLRESSYYRNYFGTNGILALSRKSDPSNNKYLSAFKELGHKIENISTTLSYGNALVNIGDGVRHSTALRYLGLAKSRPNLCLSLFTKATKIIIKNNVAVGVQVTVSNGDTYVLYARKEVIISAGAINSPKLLMLSGIGPKSHLESLGIKVYANLPVGQNFQDHPPVTIVYQMEKSTGPNIPLNPHDFPLPTFIGHVALDSSQSFPDYESVNLEIQSNSPVLPQLCSILYKYCKNICQKLLDANKNTALLYATVGLMAPKSRGHILLSSGDPNDAPLIYPGTFKDKCDLRLLASCLENYHKVVYSTYFRSVNASMVNFGFCSKAKSSKKFWKCYALKMSSSFWHYCGTCPMGTVLDTKMRVKGINRLRVIDASSMPQLIRGKLNAAVAMVAERGADILRSAWNIID